MFVRAHRDLRKGEELLISYPPGSDNQELLKRYWGFTCSCGLCVAELAAAKGSRELRRSLASQEQLSKVFV